MQAIRKLIMDNQTKNTHLIETITRLRYLEVHNLNLQDFYLSQISIIQIKSKN